MINRRGFVLLAVIWAVFGLLLYISPVKAAERPRPSITAQQTSEGLRVSVTSCEDVLAVVRIVGEAAAEKAARAAGASQAQIEQARKCLSK